MKKKYIFLVIFRASGNRKKNKNNNYNERKKNGADLERLLPKSYCEEIFCIAREWVVLQRFRLG